MSKTITELAEVFRELEQLRAQLTITQAECTRLLLENRELKVNHGITGAAAQVREFHERFGVQIFEQPGIPDEMRQLLRRELVREECLEFMEAWERQDLTEIADAIADTIYVLLGTALSYGIPIGKVFDEVHRTNMLKVREGVRDDGKILKPDGWQPPRVAFILGLK